MKRLLIILFITFSIIINGKNVYGKTGGNKVIKHIYPNKVTILYKETSGKGIIAGSIFIKGGSIEDPQDKKGLTNLAVRMLLKGSKDYSQFQLNKIFEDSGGYISASASEDYIEIDFALKVEDFDKGISVIKDLLFNPLFPEDKLQQEKQNTIAQIKAKQEEGFSYAFDELRKIIYKDTPYQYSVLGEEKDINNITIQDIKDRWNQILDSSRFVISIVGDLPYKKVEKKLKDTFANIPLKTDFKYPVYNKKIPTSECKILQREGAQTTILLAYNSPTVKEGKDFYSMKVLNGILGAGFTSRLFQEVREKKGYAYAVGSVFPTRINIGTFIAYIGTDPKNTENAKEEMVKVISSVKEGVTDEEINISKEKIVGTFLLEHQKRAKQAYYLGWFETIGMGYETDFNYTKNINKVSKSDILQVYNKYLAEGYSCVIVKP
ncbi:insulinase family protein [Venenivibrio stagnispumantis]|nr:insulinase family protein [Venenivibrio stagnispumantis]